MFPFSTSKGCDRAEFPKDAHLFNNQKVAADAKEAKNSDSEDLSDMSEDEEEESCEKEMLEDFFNEYYPQKISLNNVLYRNVQTVKEIQDIPWYVMSKIISLDPRGRNKIPCMEMKCSEDFRSVERTKKQTVPGSHPLDIINIIYLCMDPFLAQTFTEKLLMCQLSVPLLLPNLRTHIPSRLLKWPLRNVMSMGDNAVEGPILDKKTKVVSFMRFGSIEASKSEIINDVISSMSDVHHDRFCSKKVGSRGTSKKTSNGMIDMAWVHPAKKRNYLVTLLNLHGSAKEYNKEADFLVAKTTILYVFMSIEEVVGGAGVAYLENLHRQKPQLAWTCIVTQGLKELSKMEIKSAKAALRKHKLEEMCIFESRKKKCSVEDITYDINDAKSTIPLENIFSTDLYKTDEDKRECTQGKNQAQKIIELLQTTKDPFQIKKKQLPLQGQMFHDWVRKDKDEKRKNLSTHEAANLNMEKNNIMITRRKRANNPSEGTKEFLRALRKIKHPLIIRYMCTWLKLNLDSLSRHSLPQLHKEQKENWEALQNAKKDSDCDVKQLKVRDLYSKFATFEQQIVAASFGMEHLLREFCHLYQLNKQSRSQKFQDLASMAASLLWQGQAIELMDGDASYVSVAWYNAVLDSLKEKIGMKKILVVSILGLQSSGKSTLLNALFGLQFSVSAGRCTRGVYCQLVPAPKNMKYSHILVVDTEGLRAPELGSNSYTHDHEIATFVIGIGDITIVNMKGELQGEMRDVLEILVYAILKLKIQNKDEHLHPKALFVHQNVSDANASQKLVFQNRKLVNDLNEMTETAANVLKVKKVLFSEVIDFDLNSHILYFPDLYQGNPPMAPTNHCYSESINELRKKVLHLGNSSKYLCNLDIFKAKLKYVWDGVLYENFIFSFQNSLNIRAFSALEEQWSNLSLSIECDNSECLSEAVNSISEADNNINEIRYEQLQKVNENLQNRADALKENLGSYFDNHQDTEILEKWKPETMHRAKVTIETLQSKNETEIQTASEARMGYLAMEPTIKRFKAKLINTTRDLAKQIKSGKTPQDRQYLNAAFEKMWTKTVENIPNSPNVPVDTWEEIRQIIRDDLGVCDNSQAREKILHNLPDQIPSISKENIRYFVCGLFVSQPEKTRFERCKETVRNFLPFSRNDNEHHILMFLRELCNKAISILSSVQAEKFDKSKAKKLNKTVWKQLEEYPEQDINLIPFHKMAIHYYIMKYASQVFQVEHERYVRANDLTVIFEKKHKEVMWALFNSYIKERAKEGMAANTFVQSITSSITNRIEDSVVKDLQRSLQSKLQFMKGKRELLKQIASHLLEQDTFEKYSYYIEDTETFLKTWIRDEVNLAADHALPNGLSCYQEFKSKQVERLLTNITNQVRSSCKAGDHNFVNGKVWLSILHREINVEFRISKEHFDIMEHIIGNGNIETKHFAKEICDELEQLKRGMLTNIKCSLICEDELKKVSSMFETSCLGCTEVCPFCKAQCSHTMHDHTGSADHFAYLHYPQGIGGWRSLSTNKLVFKNCCEDVASKRKFRKPKTLDEFHPYSDYRDVFPTWDIAGRKDPEFSMMWRRALAIYNKQWAEEAEVPEAWKLITKEQAQEALEKEFESRA